MRIVLGSMFVIRDIAIQIINIHFHLQGVVERLKIVLNSIFVILEIAIQIVIHLPLQGVVERMRIVLNSMFVNKDSANHIDINLPLQDHQNQNALKNPAIRTSTVNQVVLMMEMLVISLVITTVSNKNAM